VAYRGQKTPVRASKLCTDHDIKPFICGLVMCTVYIDCGCLSRNIRSNELFVSLYLTLDRSM